MIVLVVILVAELAAVTYLWAAALTSDQEDVAAWDNPRNDSPAVEDTHAATHQPPN